MLSYGLIRTAVLGLAIVAMLVGAFTHSTSAQANNTPHLTLVLPQDQTFDAVIQENYPGLASQDNYTNIKPYLVILENNTELAATAYDIEWTVVLADQSLRYQDYRYFYQSLTPAGYSKILHKGEMRLLSPVFSLSPQEYVEQSAYVGSLAPHDLISFSNINTAYALMDGALFEDGRFTGSNRQMLLEQIQSSETAQHDESVIILDKLNAGESLGELLSFLDLQTKKFSIPTGSLRSQHYQYAMAREAETLRSIAIAKTGGLDAVRKRAQLLQAQLPRAVRRITE